MFSIKNFTIVLVLFSVFVASIAIPLIFFQDKKIFEKQFKGSINIRESRKSSVVRVILMGDVMLGRTVEQKSKELNDFAYPLRKVGDVLKNVDIAFSNLESPIIENCPPHTGGFVFCANQEMLEGLDLAGVDVVSLANNHTRDYGAFGIEQTVGFLSEVGILATGLGKLVVLEKNGTTFGFLGFDLTTKAISDSQLKLIKKSDAKVDVLIVGVHWGVEYKSKANELQKQIAKNLVESGVDVVVGHHPHLIQNIEYLHPSGIDLNLSVGWDRPIYYSLGNFVFDQMWSEETKKGLVVMLIFENGKLIKEERFPVYMSSWAQPEFTNE